MDCSVEVAKLLGCRTCDSKPKEGEFDMKAMESEPVVLTRYTYRGEDYFMDPPKSSDVQIIKEALLENGEAGVKPFAESKAFNQVTFHYENEIKKKSRGIQPLVNSYSEDDERYSSGIDSPLSFNYQVNPAIAADTSSEVESETLTDDIVLPVENADSKSEHGDSSCETVSISEKDSLNGEVEKKADALDDMLLLKEFGAMIEGLCEEADEESNKGMPPLTAAQVNTSEPPIFMTNVTESHSSSVIQYMRNVSQSTTSFQRILVIVFVFALVVFYAFVFCMRFFAGR